MPSTTHESIADNLGAARGTTSSAPDRVRGLRHPGVAIAFFLLAALLIGYRTARRLNVPGQFSLETYGLQDFRDAIYFPVVAFSSGKNPYDAFAYRAEYPVGQTFPLYGPITLLLHWPLGLLSLQAAEWIYFVASLAFVVALAALALRLGGRSATVSSTFMLAGFLVLTEPGQWGLSLGQSAPFLTMVAFAALYFASRRPGLAVVAVALSAMKPTWAVPLAVLMIVRGEFGVVLKGAILGGAVTLLPTLLLIRNAGGLAQFISILKVNYASFSADTTVHPLASAYRFDTAALFGRFLGTPLGGWWEVALLLLILFLAGLGLWRLRGAHDDTSRAVSASLVCVAILACVYHTTYELLMLTVPLLTTLSDDLTSRAPRMPWLRWVAFGAMLLPMLNFLVDGGIIYRLPTIPGLWLVVASINGTAIIVGLAALLLLAYGATPGSSAAGRSRVAGH